MTSRLARSQSVVQLAGGRSRAEPPSRTVPVRAGMTVRAALERPFCLLTARFVSSEESGLVTHSSVSCAGDGDTRSLAACCWVSARLAASSASHSSGAMGAARAGAQSALCAKTAFRPGSPPPSLPIQAIPC